LINVKGATRYHCEIEKNLLVGVMTNEQSLVVEKNRNIYVPSAKLKLARITCTKSL